MGIVQFFFLDFATLHVILDTGNRKNETLLLASTYLNFDAGFLELLVSSKIE